MVTDSDVELRLRGALLDHAPADGLPDHVLVDSLALGRTSVRRRRWQAAGGVAASLVVLAGLSVAVMNRDETAPQPMPAPPAPTAPPTSPEPETLTSPGIWASSLPQGAPVDVPYLAGTTVVEPDGTRVEVPGTEASIIGLSIAGPVLLAGTEVQQPYSFTTRYVLVRPTGEVEDLPVSTLISDGAQEAVVSPDGRQFTSGGDILDMTDLSVTGRMPEEADILIAWTPVGIVYLADDRYYLWREGEEPITLQSNPGVFATGSDVAVNMCGTITRLTADGTLSRISPDCVLGSWSTSPSGSWILTAAWELVSVTTGDARDLTGDTAVTNADTFRKVWWNGDDSVLFPAGDWLVRCDLGTATCEQVAGPEKSLSLP